MHPDIYPWRFVGDFLWEISGGVAADMPMV
jgi:hypothetical protein